MKGCTRRRETEKVQNKKKLQGISSEAFNSIRNCANTMVQVL